jgi:hypothetical protein
MTTERPEIILEGSNDQVTWTEYAFRYKPDRLDKKPAFCEPHMPRLDWQLWFAASEPNRVPTWFMNLEYRILTAQPEVLRLLGNNPFPDRPPKFVRAVLYQYEFTDWKTRRTTGQWWKRKVLGFYTPAVSLREPAPPAPDFHL